MRERQPDETLNAETRRDVVARSSPTVSRLQALPAHTATAHRRPSVFDRGRRGWILHSGTRVDLASPFPSRQDRRGLGRPVSSIARTARSYPGESLHDAASAAFRRRCGHTRRTGRSSTRGRCRRSTRAHTVALTARAQPIERGVRLRTRRVRRVGELDGRKRVNTSEPVTPSSPTTFRPHAGGNPSGAKNERRAPVTPGDVPRRSAAPS